LPSQQNCSPNQRLITCASGRRECGDLDASERLWHHYAVNYDSQNGTRIYKDAKIYATQRSSVGGSVTSALPSSVQAPFMLGAAESNSEYFDGSLDEVRVYNRPLSAEEIQALARWG